MRDVRQRQSGKPCSPESRSDAGQSSPSAGRKPGRVPRGGNPVSAGPRPFPRPSGRLRFRAFPALQRRPQSSANGPGLCLQSQLLGTSSPLCAAGPCLQPLVAAPGPPARPRPLFVFGGRPSSNLSSARDHTPPRRVTSQSRVPGRRTWTFRGAVILPNSPSISQGNMFWIYLGACRKSFFYS